MDADSAGADDFTKLAADAQSAFDSAFRQLDGSDSSEDGGDFIRRGIGLADQTASHSRHLGVRQYSVPSPQSQHVKARMGALNGEVVSTADFEEEEARIVGSGARASVPHVDVSVSHSTRLSNGLSSSRSKPRTVSHTTPAASGVPAVHRTPRNQSVRSSATASNSINLRKSSSRAPPSQSSSRPSSTVSFGRKSPITKNLLRDVTRGLPNDLSASFNKLEGSFSLLQDDFEAVSRSMERTGSRKEFQANNNKQSPHALVHERRMYRRHAMRRRTADAALRRMVSQVRQNRERTSATDLSLSTSKGSNSTVGEEDAASRKRRREERARQQRQRAIEDLQAKRELEAERKNKIAMDEVERLNREGKVANVTARVRKQQLKDAETRRKQRLEASRSKPSSAAAVAWEGVSSGEGDLAREPSTPSPSAQLSAKAPLVPSNVRMSAQNEARLSNHLQSSLTTDSDVTPRGSYNANSYSSGRRFGGSVRTRPIDDRREGTTEREHSNAPVVGAHAFPTEVEGGAGDFRAAGASSSSVASTARTKTTLDDLMSTLKILEQEEKLQPNPQNERSSWVNENRDKTDYLSSENLEKMTATSNTAPKSYNDGLATSAAASAPKSHKLDSILAFLDDVSTTQRISQLDSTIVQSERNDEFNLSDLNVPLVPDPTDLAEMERTALNATEEVTNQILEQKLAIDDKERSISLLQKALNQQRELTIRHARDAEKEMRKRLGDQKGEYEDTIKRHLGFIDQLIDDKKKLSDKCERVVAEVKEREKKAGEKIRLAEEQHSRELSKVKEMHAAAEKLRREKWVETQTKRIKEMTVKGLEPEIQRLVARHKEEVRQLKAIQEAELLQSDERAANRYIKMTEELRDSLEREKEAAVNREREMAQQRFERSLEQESAGLEQQRRRLYAEVQEEKERLAQNASRDRAEIERLKQSLKDAHDAALDVTRREFDAAREQQENRHATELSEMQEKLRIEKESWEENLLKRQQTQMTSTERHLKEQVRKDRDREIEAVIARFEADAEKSRNENERRYENQMKRLREKYEAEIRELEASEKSALTRVGEAKQRALDAEAQVERAKAQLARQEATLDEIGKSEQKLSRERDRVAEVVRQEVADRIVATEEENKILKQEIAELKSRHKIELERCRQDLDIVLKQKEEEMEEVHKRVKAAISKKDDVVTELRSQHQAAVKRADHLESLLETQRQQLLSGLVSGQKRK